MAKTKIDEVVEVLRRRINDGVYTSGQRLPAERDLGDELGVSRATIRNALIRLQSENLVDIAPRAGPLSSPWQRKQRSVLLHYL